MTTTDQFWQYAAEAMLDARHAKSGPESRALLDLSRMWAQAAMRSEGTIAVIAGLEKARAVKPSVGRFQILQRLHNIADLPAA
jgi:hypothetical protein